MATETPFSNPHQPREKPNADPEDPVEEPKSAAPPPTQRGDAPLEGGVGGDGGSSTPGSSQLLFLWGSNTYGQLGTGTQVNQYEPVRVRLAEDDGDDAKSESKVSLVGCASNFVVIVTTDVATGEWEAYVAGNNDRGQLATDLDYTSIARPVRLEIPALQAARRGSQSHELDLRNSLSMLASSSSVLGSRIVQIECGFESVVFLTDTGRILTMGDNAQSECAVDPQAFPVVHTPRVVTELIDTPVRLVSSKGHHVLALAADGSVWAWGSNSHGQCGTGPDSPEILTRPVEVTSLRHRGIDILAAGCFHSVCASAAGSTYVFGDNSQSQLGLGEQLGGVRSECVFLPVVVPSLDGRRLATVSCGFAHTVCLLEDQDVVMAWGSNSCGQCALGHDEDPVRRPVRVEAACNLGVTRAVCGFNTTFFAFPQGLYASGSKEDGALGVGASASDHWLPARIPGIPPLSSPEDVLVASSFTVVVTQPAGESSNTPIGISSSAAGEASPKRLAQATHPATGAPHASEAAGFGAGALTTLSDDMHALLSDNFMADLCLQAGTDGGVFYCHRAIVSSRCSRFARLIDEHAKEMPVLVGSTAPSMLIVPVARTSSGTLRRFLTFLYCGTALVDDASVSEILLLAACAHTFGAIRLLSICEDEMTLLLDSENVVLVLREACDLRLPTIKRVCMEYVAANYASSVSSRNRQVVEALGNAPELLAEVVGLSSPDFCDACIGALPMRTPCPATSLAFDFEGLLDNGAFSDAVVVAHEADPNAGPDEDGAESAKPKIATGFPVHRAFLSARVPFFASAFRALQAIKEDGVQADVTEEDRRRVALAFGARVDDEEEVDGVRPRENQREARRLGWLPKRDDQGRILVREINSSSAAAVHALLQYIYTDRCDQVGPDVAVDVLQMACLYGLARSRLGHECERVLRAYITPENALDTLCVAQQLGRDDLKQFALEYVVENLCRAVADASTLHDALIDFPILGVEIIRGVAARLKAKGADVALKRAATKDAAAAHYPPPAQATQPRNNPAALERGVR